MDLCGTMSTPISAQTKSWVLALWRALWKSMNDFIFKGTKIKSISTIICARRMFVASMANNEKAFKGPSYNPRDFNLKIPRGTAHVFSNAPFRAIDGKGSFGFAIWFDSSWDHAGSANGSKVSSSKEAEARAVHFAMKEARSRGFRKIHLLSDTSK